MNQILTFQLDRISLNAGGSGKIVAFPEMPQFRKILRPTESCSFH